MPCRGQENRALWFTNGPYPAEDVWLGDWYGWERAGPRPRPRYPWAIMALKLARYRHKDKFGEFPHTVYLDSETYERLFLDIAHASDLFVYYPPRDRIVLGMRVELEQR